MNRLKIVLWIALLFACAMVEAKMPAWIFKNGKEGYRMYRIPTLIKTQQGIMLAFCEGRNSLFDHGDIDIVMKSSADDGKSWSPLKVIYSDGKNTCGNPCPVIDSLSGDVVLLTCWNNIRVKLLRSSDGGVHWSLPVDITDGVKPDNWRWYATGPVHGIQMGYGRMKGRLVIACNHTLSNSSVHISHIIYSDDHGYTWKAGGSVPCAGTDECTVVELNNGNLMLNMRHNDGVLPNRKVSYSIDAGLNWSDCYFDTALIEPVCQGALLNCKVQSQIIVFTNPAHTKARKNLTLYLSRDEGKTWKEKYLLHRGPSAYSDLAQLANGDILCIFETGRLWPYSGIAGLTVSPAK